MMEMVTCWHPKRPRSASRHVKVAKVWPRRHQESETMALGQHGRVASLLYAFLLFFLGNYLHFWFSRLICCFPMELVPVGIDMADQVVWLINPLEWSVD